MGPGGRVRVDEQERCTGWINDDEGSRAEEVLGKPFRCPHCSKWINLEDSELYKNDDEDEYDDADG